MKIFNRHQRLSFFSTLFFSPAKKKIFLAEYFLQSLSHSLSFSTNVPNLLILVLHQQAINQLWCSCQRFSAHSFAGQGQGSCLHVTDKEGKLLMHVSLDIGSASRYHSSHRSMYRAPKLQPLRRLSWRSNPLDGTLLVVRIGNLRNRLGGEDKARLYETVVCSQSATPDSSSSFLPNSTLAAALTTHALISALILNSIGNRQLS